MDCNFFLDVGFELMLDSLFLNVMAISKHGQVFFIEDWRHPGWRIVLQKEPRSRRVLDNNDEQILGISGELIGLQLPLDMNAVEFHPNPGNVGERVPAAEIARLNALVRGERHQEEEHGRDLGRRGPGRGRGRGRRRGRGRGRGDFPGGN
jgi:hypothetical protein